MALLPKHPNMADHSLRAAVMALAWVVGTIGAGVTGQTTTPQRVTRISLGESLTLADRPAFVWMPEPALRKSPQPWILYAPTLPEYPDAHEQTMHERFLAAGIAVAGIDAGEAYGSPLSSDIFMSLYRRMTEARGFAARPCLLGRSRGGLWVSRWALRHPDKTAGIMGIYPVFDFRTYPGIAPTADAYGMTPEELEAREAELNPIRLFGQLALAKIPVCLIHGEDDGVVPIKENARAAQAAYHAAGQGSLFRLIAVPGQGHNFWPGFFQCDACIDVAIEQARAGAVLTPP